MKGKRENLYQILPHAVDTKLTPVRVVLLDLFPQGRTELGVGEAKNKSGQPNNGGCARVRNRKRDGGDWGF